MAKGDSNDIRDVRLKSLIPRGWFKSAAPVRDAVLGGLSDPLAWVYSFIGTLRLQSRIQTTTNWLLDLVSLDFLGLRIRRRAGELDDPFRARVIKEIFRERATRKGMAQAIFDITGRQPQIFEPWNTNDVGSYGITLAYSGHGATPVPAAAYSIPQCGGYGEGHFYYGLPQVGDYGSSPGAGCWGSLELNNQVFINVFRPLVNSGYVVSDAEIYNTIARTIAEGVTPWTWIQD